MLKVVVSPLHDVTSVLACHKDKWLNFIQQNKKKNTDQPACVHTLIFSLCSGKYKETNETFCMYENIMAFLCKLF